MNQVVVYKSSSGLIILYRGGYDKENEKGLDPFCRLPNDELMRASYETDWPITHGYILHYDHYGLGHSKFEDVYKFFGFDPKKKDEDQQQEVNLNLCFDKYGRLIFYKSEGTNRIISAPQKIKKIVKTRCKFFKDWYPRGKWYEHNGPWLVEGYKLEKQSDYIIVEGDLNHIRYCLLPEYDFLKYSYYSSQDYYRFCDILYNQDPISLGKSYDWSENQKLEILRIKEETKRKKKIK
jgi:hypothetical protein